MKCPKCGYLGFETTDRCRNCQYDFSLSPSVSEPELTLHGNRKTESPLDLDLPVIARPPDPLTPSALDLDRLFGDPEPSAAERDSPTPLVSAVKHADAPVDEPAPFEDSMPLAMSHAEQDDEIVERPGEPWHDSKDEAADRLADWSVPAIARDESALPFDDGPLVPPPAARTPLAVRRSTPEVPRNRPRTTRPVRVDGLDLEGRDQAADKSGAAAKAASETVALLLEAPSLAVRVGAGLIDLLLLIGIDAAVLYLTLRITGLQNSLDDLRVLPPVPFIGFLAILGFGYVAGFTVAGGQTIGKMMLSLRVIGDDGRSVDAAGGMIRALGCMLVPVTLGLSYLPALFTSDHRALHDRLAGTRVVQE